jgi:hypothetical protein
MGPPRSGRLVDAAIGTAARRTTYALFGGRLDAGRGEPGGQTRVEANRIDVSLSTPGASGEEAAKVPGEQGLPPEEADRSAEGQERAERNGFLATLAPEDQETERDEAA